MPAHLLLVDACQAGGKRRIARDWAILAARHLWQIGLMAHVVRVADMRAARPCRSNTIQIGLRCPRISRWSPP